MQQSVRKFLSGTVCLSVHALGDEDVLPFVQFDVMLHKLWARAWAHYERALREPSNFCFKFL